MRIREVRTIPLEDRLPQPGFDGNYIRATKPALVAESEKAAMPVADYSLRFGCRL